MDILKNLVGGEKHPPLPEDNYATARVRQVQNELHQLVSETKDRIEVVPAEHLAYVFIGKPPKKFGMAWITGGEVANLGELAKAKNFSPITLEKIEDELGEAYRQSESDQRYECAIGGETVIVTPSESLESEVHRIIQAILD